MRIEKVPLGSNDSPKKSGREVATERRKYSSKKKKKSVLKLSSDTFNLLK